MQTVRLLFYPLKGGEHDELLNEDSLVVNFESLLIKNYYFEDSTGKEEINEYFWELQKFAVVWVDSWSIEE